MYTQQVQGIRAQSREHLAALLQQLAAQSKSDDVIKLVDRFIACFDDIPAYVGYKHIPTSAYQVCEQVKHDLGAGASRDFLYACILRAIVKTLDSEAFERLPVRVKGHQLKQFNRLLVNASSVTQSSEIGNDLFHKEFGLASLRLYAAACNAVDYNSGIERALLFKGGWMETSYRLAIFIKMGGFKPFFQLHTHLSYLDEYNEEGRKECYRCCVDLYASHPRVLGMFAGSWLYDPALPQISPRLAYLREIAQKGGAYVLFNSINEQSTQDAISKSPTRKKLYLEGAYQPKNYALIWPRASQTLWAQSNNGPSPQLD